MTINADVLGAAVAVIMMLLWIRRDMRTDIAELKRDLAARVDSVSQTLAAQIAAVNARIDSILLSDRNNDKKGDGH